MKTTFILAASVVLAGSHLIAAERRPENPYNKVFATLIAPDYPNKAAAEVKKADAGDKASVTALVVKSAVGLRPASAPAVAASIARENPELAPVAAYTAAIEQPKQASAIARATAAAAPAQAGKIVGRLCVAVPKDYKSIALAAAKAAPEYTRDILSAVAEANPDLKPGIDLALANQQGNFEFADFAVTLERAQNPDTRAPGVGRPPFTTSGPQPMIPPGGGNYSRP